MSYGQYRQRKRSGRRKLLLAGLPVLLLMVGAGAWYFWQQRTSDDPPASASQQTADKPAYTSVEGKYLFSGTIMLGRAVEREAQLADGSYDYEQPFSKLDTLGIDEYDAGIADLECPVTDTHIPYRQQVDNLIFNCPPEWLPTLGKYYPILNRASNHAYDLGAEGFEEGTKHIEEAGLQPVGNFSPREGGNCSVVALPVRLQKQDAGEEKASLPLAICAFQYFTFSPEAGELEEIADYAEVMPVIGLFMGGPDYQPIAAAGQRQIAHRMIDLGAEFVIGNGTHWVQDTEVYKGKLIAYSTGNFIFDQLDHETRIGLSIAVDMSMDYNENIAGWLRLGDSCKPVNDTCLDTARNQGLQRFSPSYTFDAIGSYGGFRRVTEKANNEQQADIERRAKWAQTSRELGRAE